MPFAHGENRERRKGIGEAAHPWVYGMIQSDRVLTHFSQIPSSFALRSPSPAS